LDENFLGSTIRVVKAFKLEKVDREGIGLLSDMYCLLDLLEEGEEG